VSGTPGENAEKRAPVRLPPNWMNLLLDNISDAVLVTDCEGFIHFWNPGAEKTFQYTAGEARGRHLNLLYVPTEGEEFQEAQLLAQDGEVLSDVEALMKRKDGTVRTVLLSIVPVLGDTGEVEFLACIGKDITLVRGLEEKVLAAEKLETVKEMIITLNHKMSQPLAVAGCYLGMLLSEKMQISAGERSEYLREIESQLDSVANLLRRIAEMEEVRTVEYLAENRMVVVEDDKGPRD
jgi:PAS domain S-box-containing protein